MKLNAKIIGMMSGTSADGIDAVLVEFREEEAGKVYFAPLGHIESPLSPELRAEVLAACAKQADTQAVCRLSFALGEAFATAAQKLITQLGISPEEVDLIASHGQTVWHQVEAGMPFSTLQIAEPAVIAARTGITTSANFRVADVAEGGQGAPLAAFFDYAFFNDAHKTRALQNIGGIGNVTFLPAGEGYAAARAFDTGPGNVLIDFAMAHYTNGLQTIDEDGKLGATGQVNTELLAQLLTHPYFTAQPPKTTGRELFSESFWQEIRAAAALLNLSASDTIATITAFTAHSIALEYSLFGPAKEIDEVIVSGGGGRNPFLMKLLDMALQERLGRKVSLRLHDEFGLEAKLKEATFFALFGYELLRGRPTNLPACTGATDFVLMGQLTPGKNYAALLSRFAPYMLPESSKTPLSKLLRME
jgi:anhydro-N-acetylmuramic acid kinase